MTFKEKLQHKYALSEQGAKDMIHAFISATISNIVLMFPVGMLYLLVKNYMEGTLKEKGILFAAGCLICLILIGVTTYIQYNATFLSTYVESGVRRITLAEKLRKIPLSFFGKKDLSDLTSTIMADCATLETASSHWIPELVGACISTALVAVSLFFFDWRMAIAALWLLPVSFLIVGCSGNVQRRAVGRQMDFKMACTDGIQECLETVRDLRANNAQAEYIKGLDSKIRAVEKHAIVTELTTAVFVASAQMILKFGIATTALVGSDLLAEGKIDVLTFFMFLLLVSRLYDPLQISLQNLAAIISADVQCKRMDEILSHDIQAGSEKLTNQGYDIEFTNVGFAYNDREDVLKDVTFTAKQGEVTALVGPSGGGKTTLAKVIMGLVQPTSGRVLYNGEDVTDLSITERAKRGIFLSFQNPLEVPGVTLSAFIRSALEQKTGDRLRLWDFKKKLKETMALLNMDESYAERDLNVGFSGGEKKKAEILQMLMLEPKLAILDETDSGLDVDAVRTVSEGVRLFRERTHGSLLIITHSTRILEALHVDAAHVMENGVIVKNGGAELVEAINEKGFGSLKTE